MVRMKDQFLPLVNSVLAQSSRRHSVVQIRPELKLNDLGLDSAEIANVKTRLFRTVAGRNDAKLPMFLKALRITPNSTVREVTTSFARTPLVSGILLPAAASLPGDDTTETKGFVETAVRAVLSQASARPYMKITSELKLADLGLDSVGIVDLKTDIFRTFSGSRHALDFDKFSKSLNVSPAIAAFLKVPVSWVYERTRRRGIERLPHVKLGKYLRFSMPEIKKWLEEQYREI